MNSIDPVFNPQSSPIRRLQSECPKARITTALLRMAHDEKNLPLSPKQVRELTTRVHHYLTPEDSSTSEDEEDYDQTIASSRLMHCGERIILELPESLGEGQSGEVKLGLTSEGKCAIKPRNSQSLQSKKTEEAEIYALQTLSDIPEVLNLLAVNDDYIVLEFCSSDLGLLINFIHEGDYNLPADDLHNFCRQIATAIDKMHKKGIIHSDLKPDNIMFILEEERIKIADFDFSVDSSDKIHGGSFVYYPPEQLVNIDFEFNCHWRQKEKRIEWDLKETELSSAMKENNLQEIRRLIEEIEALELRIAPPLTPAIDVWSGGLVMAELSWEYLSEPFKKRLREYKETMIKYANICNGNPVIYAALVCNTLKKWKLDWVQEIEGSEWSGIFAGLQPTNEIEMLLTKALDFDPATRISSDQMKQRILNLEGDGRSLASPILH